MRQEPRRYLCPRCNEKLGGWRFRIVHDLRTDLWFYRCDCGWEGE